MDYLVKIVFVFFIIVNYVRTLPFAPINNAGIGSINMNLRRFIGNLQTNNNFLNTIKASNTNGYGTNIQFNRQFTPNQGDLSQQQNYYNNGNIQQYYPELIKHNDEFRTEDIDAPQQSTITPSVTNVFNYAATTSPNNLRNPIINSPDEIVIFKNENKNKSQREHENENEENQKHELKSMTKTKFFFQFQPVVPEVSRKFNKETVYYLE